MEPWLQSAWDAGETTRAARRARTRQTQKHGSHAAGLSPKVLATIVPNKRRHPKRGKR